jgi:uncharacterized protein (DUF433 family)
MAVLDFKIGQAVVRLLGYDDSIWFVVNVTHFAVSSNKEHKVEYRIASNLFRRDEVAYRENIRLATPAELAAGKRLPNDDGEADTKTRSFKRDDVVVIEHPALVKPGLFRIRKMMDSTSYIRGYDLPECELCSVVDENDKIWINGRYIRHATEEELNPNGLKIGDRVYIDYPEYRDNPALDKIVVDFPSSRAGLTSVGSMEHYWNTFAVKKRPAPSSNMEKTFSQVPSLQSYGVTSRPQADRAGKWILSKPDRTAETVLGYDAETSNTIANLGEQINFGGKNGAPTVITNGNVEVAHITYAYLNGHTPEEIAIHYNISLSQTFEALALGLLMRSRNLKLPPQEK